MTDLKKLREAGNHKKLTKIMLQVLLFVLWGCTATQTQHDPLKVAFMSDVHLQNVYGEFEDCSFKGIQNPVNGKYATIRTMASQLKSTRLFNENYFAFLAALDDVAKKGIKLVVLPGDFSDDGQPINLIGLREILSNYEKKYGIRFYLTTGNHDPVRPFFQHAGKKDFLGEKGMQQAVMSKEGMYVPANGHPVAVSHSVAELGYKGILEHLGDFGFYPDREDQYWETPFSSYDYDTYSFEVAAKEALLGKRFYDITPNKFQVPDVSYLVEPVPGLWLLAIDANVYIPKEKTDSDRTNPKNYNGTGTGYNNVLTHKRHLIDWVTKVSKEAEKQNKTLVAFSHYPMVDFHNDASAAIQDLLGQGKMQTYRVPKEEVAQVFADAGIKIHFAGHMHVNDTGVRKSPAGNTLVNVQVPSLAAYIPAYKLLTIQSNRKMEIETCIIDSVPRFNDFFELYSREHDYLQQKGEPAIWNREVLLSASYLEFTEWHLKELVRLRFVPGDWPEKLRDAVMQLNGMDLLVLSQLEKADKKAMEQFFDVERIEKAARENALHKADSVAQAAGMKISSFENWNGMDLLVDLYKLRNADELAFADIGENRLKAYQLIFSGFEQNERIQNGDPGFYGQLTGFSKIINKFMNGRPSNHFMIDLEQGSITNLNQQ